MRFHAIQLLGRVRYIEKRLSEDLGTGVVNSSSGVAKLLVHAFQKVGILEAFALFKSIEGMFFPEALMNLTKDSLEELGGEESEFSKLYESIIDTMHTLLIACDGDLEVGDWIIRCNIWPKLEKGASRVQLFRARMTLHEYYVGVFEEPYPGILSLPPNGLSKIIEFMIDSRNRRTM